MRVKISNGKTIKTIEYTDKVLLSTAIKDAGFSMEMPCNGKATCKKCIVKAEGELSEKTAQENDFLQNKDSGFRLSCLAYALGDVSITLKENDTQIVTDGYIPSFLKIPIATGYGFAVDIGTTTVVVYLFDLDNQKLLGKTSFKNPQDAYGADVISRIEEALTNTPENLNKLIKQKLTQAFEQLCKEFDVDKLKINASVITGNTTMLYLLIKQDITPLSQAPFKIERFFGETIKNSELHFSGFDNNKIYLPHTISAFVGSDITCTMLSSQIMQGDKPNLVVDIGTNGEMALFANGEIYCCSTAAGPAFEGAGITMGSAAIKGAINKVYIYNNELCFTTIDNATPTGICGSGIIDAISVFVKTGVIDSSGLIDEENESFEEYICKYNDEVAIQIGDSDVYITQKDIREIQLAKSAICAGIYSLINSANITCDDIENLYLAGGFGSFIDVLSACNMGLIPTDLKDKAKALGNSAAMGAIMILLSGEQLENSSAIAKKAQLVDLSTSSYFMDKYVEGMMF